MLRLEDSALRRCMASDALWPALALGAVVASSVSNILFGRSIGDSSCEYTLSYSPDNRAFGLWGVLYTAAFVSTITQIAEPDARALPEANALFASSWGLAAVWVAVFTQAWPSVFSRARVQREGQILEDANPRTRESYVASALILITSAACALAAAAVERPWTGTALRAGVNGVAFSLLAGWLAVASSLAVGIAYKAATGESQACERRDARKPYSMLSSDYGEFTAVPLMLGLGVGAAAGALPDPLITAGLAWAVVNLKYTHANLLALLAAFAGFATALARLAPEFR